MELTKTQKTVLQRLDDGQDLVYEKGAGWWNGLNRTNGKLALFLIRNALISRDDIPGNPLERYRINESGRFALAGEEEIYRLASGKMVATMAEVTGKIPQNFP